MDQKTKEAIFEAVKTGIRNIWFSVISVILLGINTQTGDIAINWKIVTALALVSIITTVDSFMHEWGKVNKNDAMKNGLSFGV